MICCNRCFYLLAFFLFFAAVAGYSQASCNAATENSPAVSLQFGSDGDDVSADAHKFSCSKQNANIAVKAVQAEGASQAKVLNCNPSDCEPCPIKCCVGFPGCCKAKVADAQNQQSAKTVAAALAARKSP